MSESEKDHAHPNYTRIYIALVVLLIISVVGNFTGVMWITLIIAFGVALVKANLVIQNFMHLRTERRLIKWMLTTSLVLMALLLAGTMPDIMKHHGLQWENVAAQEEVARGIPLDPEQAREQHPGPVPLTAPGAEEQPMQHPAPSARSERPAPPPPVAMASVVPMPHLLHRQGFDAKGTFNSVCATCHGQDGKGDGAAAAALDPKPANFTDPAFWKANPDDSVLFKAIKDGGASVGKSPMMVAWGGTYSDDQIHALLKYIETTFKPKAKGGA